MCLNTRNQDGFRCRGLAGGWLRAVWLAATTRSSCGGRRLDGSHLDAKHVAIQKQQGAQRLILR